METALHVVRTLCKNNDPRSRPSRSCAPVRGGLRSRSVRAIMRVAILLFAVATCVAAHPIYLDCNGLSAALKSKTKIMGYMPVMGNASPS